MEAPIPQKHPLWLVILALVFVVGGWTTDAYLDRFVTLSASPQPDAATGRTIPAPNKLPGYVDQRHYAIHEAVSLAETVLFGLIVIGGGMKWRRSARAQ